MLSAEIKRAHVFLELCKGRGGAEPIHIDAVLRSLAACHADALALEAAQVPRGQRLTEAQWDDPKIAVLPVIPRDQALRR